MGANFNVRSAGIVIKNGKVLMQKRKGDKFYALPGGGVEKDEFSIAALKREFIEECGEANFSAEKLLFVCECKFNYGGKSFQQLGFYYLLEPSSEFTLDKNLDFAGIEEEKGIEFKWLDLSSIENAPIKPDFLKKHLNNLPNEVTHILIEE